MKEFFRIAYRSPLEEEVRKNFRYLAHQECPTEPETFYLKFIGVGFVQAMNDDLWYRSFRSQILTLTEANKNSGWLVLSRAKEIYEEAAKANPKEYANDTFERWLTFLTGNNLLIRHPSEMLEITTRGKDFLCFMAHWGRDAQDKRL